MMRMDGWIDRQAIRYDDDRTSILVNFFYIFMNISLSLQIPPFSFKTFLVDFNYARIW